MKREKHRFAVVGVGPTGGIMAVHLCDGDQGVILVDVKRSHMDAIRENGLRLTGVRDLHVRPQASDICYSIAELEGKDFDVVLVSVKAAFLEGVVAELERVVPRGTTVVSVQNGLDTEKLLAKAFGEENSLRMVVNYAGMIESDGLIRFTFFNAPNYIGVVHPSAEERAREIAAAMSACGMDTHFAADIQKYAWAKTLLNASLSPVCSLTGKSMVRIMSHPVTKALVEELLQEGMAVARASGIRLDEGFYEYAMGYLRKGGDHHPSMYFDLKQGNPTEIDFINGKIVEYGGMCGVPTPLNRAITVLIKGAELPSSG